MFKAAAVLSVLASLMAASAIVDPGVAAADTRLLVEMPSGNIACTLSDGQYALVRCGIHHFTYTPPAPEVPCGVKFGEDVEMSAGQRPAFECARSHMSYDSGPRLLAYGDSVSVGSFTCDSSANGIHCADHAGGHSFTLSRDSYELD